MYELYELYNHVTLHCYCKPMNIYFFGRDRFLVLLTVKPHNYEK